MNYGEQSLFVPKQYVSCSLTATAEHLLSLVGRRPQLDPYGRSRLVQLATSVLKEGAAVIEPSRNDFSAVIQAMKDLREIHFAACMLGDKLDLPQWFGRLSRCFTQDSVLPSLSDPSDEGRSAQYELLVGAMLERGSFRPQPIPSGEGGKKSPDFRCDFLSQAFAAEAKKLRGVRSLRKRFYEACEQVRRGGLPGIVFIDFSMNVNPGDQVFVAPRPMGRLDAVQRKRMARFWPSHRIAFEAKARQCRVFGVVFMDHLLVHEGHTERGDGNWYCSTIVDIVRMPTDSVEDGRLGGLVRDALNGLALPWWQ